MRYNAPETSLLLFFLFNKGRSYGLVPPDSSSSSLSYLETVSRASAAIKNVSAEPSRRSFLIWQGAVCLGLATNSKPIAANAIEGSEQPDNPQQQSPTSTNAHGGRPFAPKEALLPAARCKIWIDRAYDVSSSLVGEKDESRQYKILVELNTILSNQPKLFVANGSSSPSRTTTPSVPPQSNDAPSSRPFAQISTRVSSANKEEFQQNRNNLSLPDQLAAAFNQADVERQWGMLKYQEAKMERDNEARAALNFYTSQLNYADYYVLTADRQDKKRMIRNDQLPSLTSVIASDLDLRDLYRNDFLTSIEDAKAEVSYQIRTAENATGDDKLDTADVIDLMNQAHTSIVKWFELIAPQDVQEAMEVVATQK